MLVTAVGIHETVVQQVEWRNVLLDTTNIILLAVYYRARGTTLKANKIIIAALEYASEINE